MTAKLTLAQEALVRDSYDLIKQATGPLASLFYGRLFSYAPALRPLFRSDLRTQGQKLMAMLDSCVEGMGRLDQLRPQLRELGRRHVAYGARPEHYPIVSRALLWSLGQALEHRFDPETRAAWSALLNSICAEMQAGASEPGTAADATGV